MNRTGRTGDIRPVRLCSRDERLTRALRRDDEPRSRRGAALSQGPFSRGYAQVDGTSRGGRTARTAALTTPVVLGSHPARGTTEGWSPGSRATPSRPEAFGRAAFPSGPATVARRDLREPKRRHPARREARLLGEASRGCRVHREGRTRLIRRSRGRDRRSPAVPAARALRPPRIRPR